MTKDTKTLLYVLGGAAVLGIGGAVIYNAVKKPAAMQGNGSTTKLPTAGSSDSTAATDAAAKAAADKAAADKAAADAQAVANAVANAAAKAAADAQRKIAVVAARNAFSATYNTQIAQQGVSNAQAMTAAFISGIQAVQALGTAPGEVLDLVWEAAVDFLITLGWSRAQAETLASDAQQAAGFGRHVASSQVSDGYLQNVFQNMFQGNV